MSTCLKDFGVVCALGKNKQQVANALTDADKQYLQLNNELPLEQAQYVGRVDIDDTVLPEHVITENNRLAFLAYSQIQSEVQQLVQQYGSQRIAVIIGTSTASIHEGELARRVLNEQGKFPDDFQYQIQEMSAPANYIAFLANAKGPVYGISTACSSSAKALISAKSLLDNDLADVVIAGGIDSLTRLTVNGFKSLESISDAICRPFSVDRDGINIGEAAALFLMTKDDGGIQFLGGGETSDAYHISAPSPDGAGAAHAMKLALNDANIDATDIDYVNLHGTGTIKNDAMEAQAMADICGLQVNCSSTKFLTGHTLGAAGALEIGLCWLLLSDYNSEQKLPCSNVSDDFDSKLPKINLSDGKSMENFRYCMSNSFAFGGNNVSVVIGKAHE